MKYTFNFLIFFILSNFLTSNANANDVSTKMLVKIQFIESDGGKAFGSVIILNEKTNEKLKLSPKFGNKNIVLKIINVKQGVYSLHSYETLSGKKVKFENSGYKFEIKHNQLNYVGDWILTENWKEFMSKKGKVGVSFDTSFSKETIEQAFSKFPEHFNNTEFNVAQAL